MKIFNSFFDFYTMTSEERKNINKSLSFFAKLWGAVISIIVGMGSFYTTCRLTEYCHNNILCNFIFPTGTVISFLSCLVVNYALYNKRFINIRQNPTSKEIRKTE